MRTLVCVTLLSLSLLGCGGDSGPDPIDVQGSYAGTIQGSGSPGQLHLTLVESNGTVTGSGSVSSSSDAVSLTVAGSYTQPTVSLVLSAQGYEDINVTGTVTSERITGAANGSGFVNGVVLLDRQ